MNENSTMLYAILGALLLLLILMIFAGIVIRRRLKENKKEKEKDVTPDKIPQNTRQVPFSSVIKGNVEPPTHDDFKKLLQYDGGLGQRFTTAQGTRYNKIGQLNLIPTNLPFDHNRIKLKTPVEGCDYINANWITPPTDDTATYDQLIYTSHLPFDRIRFGVGQEPLPHTEKMYFQAIHEQKFDFVLSFTNKAKEDSFEIDELRTFEGLNLHVLSRTQINEHLYRSEISLTNSNSSGNEYKHNFNYFEFDAWPKEERVGSEVIELLVSSICIMRNEIAQNKSSLKILATDSRGGIGASAAFLVMYEIMQNVDEAFTQDNQLKQSANYIDVFAIVNRLRKDRERMIEDFTTYKLLFQCLEYYGTKREFLNRSIPKSMNKNTRETNKRNTSRFHRTNNVEGEIEYVMHEQKADQNDIFEDYYDDQRVVDDHKYQNIEEMSEYL